MFSLLWRYALCTSSIKVQGQFIPTVFRLLHICSIVLQLLAFVIQKGFPNILNYFRIFVDVFDEMLAQEMGIVLYEMPHDVKL